MATPALIARGESLFTADGCSACHSLSGRPGVGPSLNAIAGRKVTLNIRRDDHLRRCLPRQSIVSPDAQIVKGYGAGIMSAAIASDNFRRNPAMSAHLSRS